MRGGEEGLLPTPWNWTKEVLAALDKLPQPKRGPRRDNRVIVNRYFTAIVSECLLNRRRNDQVLLNIYHIRRDQIKRQLGEFRLNQRRIYWLDWFEQQSFSLYKILNKGSNITEENTQVELNFDFISDLELESVPREVLVDHYDQLNKQQPDNITHTNIDIESLALYIERTRTSIKTGQRWSRRQKRWVWASPEWCNQARDNLKQAVQILKLVNDDHRLPQPFKISEFGRVYLMGVNLQNCSRVVRHAALGHCFSIDFSVCSTAWRLHQAQNIDSTFTAPETLRYIKDKQQFRWDLARLLGDNHISNAKTLLTCIGFGASLDKEPWPMKNGQAGLPAVREIISPEQINDLKQSAWFMQYIQEQDCMNDLIYHQARQSLTNTQVVDCVKDARGRIQRKKVMAYLYQQAEAEYLSVLVDYISRRFGTDEILLMIHDCVYLKHSVNMAEVNSLLQNLNPYLQAERTEHWGQFDADQGLQEQNKLDAHQQQAQDFLNYWQRRQRREGHYDGSNQAEGYYCG
jgi:hypothetical protein